MAHTQDHKNGYKLTQNSIKHEPRAPEHLFQVPGQAGSKANCSRRAKGSEVLPCASQMQRLAFSANIEAYAASSTSSAVAKLPAKRYLTFFSSVQLLLADGDHLDG